MKIKTFGADEVIFVSARMARSMFLGGIAVFAMGVSAGSELKCVVLQTLKWSR